MKQDRPYIYLFKTPGKHYVYDVNKHSVLPIEKEVYRLLRKARSGEVVEHSWITKAKERGYLSSKRIKEIEHPVTEVLEDFLNNYVSKITLQVTQQCNFRCEYCTYSDNSLNRHHNQKKMSFETAKKGIDFLMAHSKDIEGVYVSFYGGEPLLEFDLIKQCIEYAKNVAEGRKIMFSMTTNGSLLNKEIIEYFIENKMSLMISVDGPKHVHDKNRRFAFNDCGTFDKIMERLQFVKDNYPEFAQVITINAVIDPESDLKCSTEFFSTDEVLKACYVRTALLDDEYSQRKYEINETSVADYQYEKFKFLLNLLGRLDKNEVSPVFVRSKDMYDKLIDDLRKPVNGFIPDKGHHAGPCIPGQLRLFLDVDGVFYPCERVLETCDAFVIGNVEEGFDYDKIKFLLNIGKLTEKECIECYAIKRCTVCAARAVEYNEYSNTLSRKKKLQACVPAKVQFDTELKDVCTLLEFGYKPA